MRTHTRLLHALDSVDSPSPCVPHSVEGLAVFMVGNGERVFSDRVWTDKIFDLRARDFFIDNLLVRIHVIVEMILVDRPCAMGV